MLEEIIKEQEIKVKIALLKAEKNKQDDEGWVNWNTETNILNDLYYEYGGREKYKANTRNVLWEIVKQSRDKPEK